MGELTAHVDVPLDGSAPTAARHGVVVLLTGWGFDDADWLYNAALVTSELVTNAVRHGGGCLALQLYAHDNHVTVSVTDGTAVLPERRADADSEGGRGIAIIEGLAERWGVENHEGGKRVWVLLPEHPPVAGGATPSGRSCPA